ncbi:MAG: hypothetical protein CMI54_00245 [Parcubacteria group bacterium]|nr:hypothetical protein [Parcubacteria group bacterium]|tara:strand:- start:24094 stop:26148 length:2055 start_codon:yes stop_codon:yes gene_type:complete
MNEKKENPKSAPKKRASRAKKQTPSEPLMTSSASTYDNVAMASSVTSFRRNKAGSIERTDKFTNIENGLIPFKTTTGSGQSGISIRDAVILCQKAYYNFSIFRNTIDLMTEFSTSEIYFEGGSKKSQNFFESLFKKTNVWDLQDRFFREYYRSGNVFLYRFDAKLKPSDVKKISQTFGGKTSTVEIPYRYVILNPADIQIAGSLNFSQARKYHKVLTDYELERIRNPKTDEDKQIYNSLDPTTKKSIKQAPLSSSVIIELDAKRFHAVFYKKQDYEPYSVPMGYPVLEDINHKAELKKMDMAITRTVQQAILLVTMGAEPEKGGINQENLLKMQALFENQSVGRVLIADYTTKAEFVIPQVRDILDPKKYDVVNTDINAGLNNMLTGVDTGGEKFANISSKVEVFIARLRQARKTFLNDFLIPEVKRISKELGFKNYPTPKLKEIMLRDNTEKYRVYTRMAELGLLTPEELFEALDSNRLPNKEDSMDSQKRYIGDRDEGLYFPLVGGSPIENPAMEEWVPQEIAHPELQKPVTSPNTAPNKATPKKSQTTSPNVGRPPGTEGIPQERKKAAAQHYSFESVKSNIIKSQELEKDIEKELRKIHKKKRLTNQQKEIAKTIGCIILANESPENWKESIAEYCKKPIDQNKDQVSRIEDIAVKHQLDTFLASILFHSVIESKENKNE